MTALPSPQEIRENFQFLENWEDRYAYIIDLGHALPPYPQEFRSDDKKVRGCAAQVWLHTRHENGVLYFDADSDAHIVRGLIAILLSLYSGKTPQQVLSSDAKSFLKELKLADHLTAQRANGLAAMVRRIEDEARAIV
ncbi:MAG: SufE family protein [Pseudomonadota bacterium]